MASEPDNLAARFIDWPGQWGLFPERPGNKNADLKSTLRYYFIEFNPLYFISVCCVLYGIFLIAQNVDALGFGSRNQEQLLLFGVIQAYEALIIAGAAFLVHRARAVRPAVLLCLLECVLMFDCTFRLEGISLLGGFGIGLIALWLLLTGAKIWAMSRAMRVQLARTHYAAIIASGAAIAGVIMALSRPGVDKPLVLQIAAWLGAFVLLILDARRVQPACLLAMNDKQRLMAGRCATAAFRILAGFYFYHVWAFILMAAETNIRAAAILPQAAAILLLLMLIRERDRDIWRFGLLTLAASVTAPVATPYAFLLVGAVCLFRVWKGAHSNLALGAAFAMYGGLCLFGWQGWGHPLPDLPAMFSWQTCGLVIALLLIGILLRNLIALLILAGGLLYAGFHSSGRLMPASELGRGVLVLAIGFTIFLIGLAVNWWLRTLPSGTASPQFVNETGVT